ncbi:MAG: alpha/beta hydrolase [Planctomycetaceae bacterium]|nr:alpha/beta hydrolase [Planctomycetaceae bacterium]
MRYTVFGCLIVLILLVSIFGGCADMLARKMLFHPSRYPNSQDFSTETFREVSFVNAKKQTLYGYYFPYQKTDPKEKPKGSILYCHGNGENISHLLKYGQSLRSEFQCNVLIFDYAGYGKSGGKPTAPGVLDDGLAALTWLMQHEKIPADQIILYGFSLGGCVAVDLASKHKIKGLIVESSFTSLGEIGEQKLPFIPAKKLLREQLASVDKIGKVQCPVFISHGKADRVIPFEHGEKLFAAAKEPKKFYIPPEGFDFHSAPHCDAHTELLKEFIGSLP